MTLKKTAAIGLMILIAGGVGAWKWTQKRKDQPSFEPVRVQRGDISISILAT